MDSIGLEATAASSGDIHNLNYPAVIVLLLLVIILAVISSRGLRMRGLGVNHLFLKIKLMRNECDIIGFVRSLDVDSMRLVLPEAPAKGEKLSVNLSSLPGFPAEGQILTGTVQSVKSITGNQNFMVALTLESTRTLKSSAHPLVQYLRHLHA